MIKLFHFHNPTNFYFAQASRRGTWYPENAKVCIECGASRQKRISPLVIEWEAGSDIVGDFVWPGFDDELVVTQKVRDVLEERYHEIVFGPVEFWQNPKLRPPIRIKKRSKPRVWMPYLGLALWDVIPTSWCHLNHLQSNVSIAKECSTCGTILYKIPIAPHRRLVIDITTWEGTNIFRIHENPGLIFCTEGVKRFVESAGFSNASFLEDGIIPD